MGNQQATGNLDLAWLGGMMDGEGCFSLHKRMRGEKMNLKPHCTIANSDARAIERVHQILEAHGVGHYIQWKAPEGRGKESFQRRYLMGQVNIFGYKRVQALCQLLLPYLVVKADQAATMLEYVNYRLEMGPHYGAIASRQGTSYSDVDWQYYERMKTLKIPAAPETARRTQRHGDPTDGYTGWQSAEVAKIQSDL